MAAVQVVSPLPLAEQAKALNSFLSKRGVVLLSESTAYAIATALELRTPTDSKSVAQRLRAELKAHGTLLPQSQCYEALARLCGFANWMRANTHFAAYSEGAAPEGFAMRVIQVAGAEGPFQAYESLPKLATALIDIALKDLGRKVGFARCNLLRGRRGMRVEFEPSDALGFSFEVVSYRRNGEDIEFVELESEAIAGFASRLERAIEMGHRGAIVSGTVMSPALPHWYHPTYALKSLRNQARDVKVANELELFVMLEGVGIDAGTRFDAKLGVIFGATDDVRVAPIWVSQESEEGKPVSLTPGQFNSLMARFLRLKHLLRRPFSEVMMLLSTGATDAKDFFPLDQHRLAQSRKEQGLSLQTLAQMASISVLDLVRIERYGHAHEVVIDKLARALGLPSGNALLPEEGGEGSGMRLESADSLMRVLSDTHLYRCIISDHFQEQDKDNVEAIAENIRECGDLVQIGEGAMDEVFHSQVSTAALKRSLQDSLDELAKLGGTIVVSRSLHYAGGHEDAPGLKGMPVHTVTMFFERLDKLRAQGGASLQASGKQEARHG